MQLKGCTVLITGAAKRVGRAIALNLAAAGADVLIHYHRSEKEAVALQKLIQKKFRKKSGLVRGDLGRFRELKRIADEAWGLRRKIDVLVNNASTFYPTPLGKVREAQWEDLFNVNARAPFFLSEAIGLRMKKRGQGKIVNIADWAALQPYTQYVPYCASKAALVAVSQGMARTLAPEVQVNTILPGPVMWPDDLGPAVLRSVLRNTPLRRIGTPGDIANAVKFLIESGDFMTGSLLHVDGGRHID
ncbi:MAG: SDR family oxidoreductase [bacterium]